jgi:hypothetical protein
MAAYRGRSTWSLSMDMLQAGTVGFGAMVLGLIGLFALTIGGLLRLIRPLSQLGGRLLICCGVAGALALVVGLGLVAITVGRLHSRDDVGLIGYAVIAYFVGAGLGVPIFAVREFRGSGPRGPAA